MMYDLPPDHPGRVAYEAIYQYAETIPGLEAITPYPINYDDDMFDTSGGVIATADVYNNRITFYNGHSDIRRFLNTLGVRLMNNAPKNEVMGYGGAMAIRATLHELAHTLPSGTQYAKMTYNQRAFEEGVSDALALDLTQHVALKLFGARYFSVSIGPEDTNYEKCTRFVRQLSVSITGAKMRSPQARRYRFQLAAAPLETRNEMLRQAGIDPLGKIC